ncbi:MAG: 50S ribosomal protein L20 [bacterium]
MRVKRGTVRKDKHKKILKKAKGFIGRRNSVYKLAKQAVIKAGQYSYRDRKVKKRVFRALWITRLNAAVHGMGMTYSTFINKLGTANITINRKILADIAVNEPKVFEAIVAKLK